MSVYDKIINGSHELFTRFGVKSITMDDIAKHLSISKKTIYQYFKDKNDLVISVSKMHLEQEREEIQSIKDQTTNAIETLIEESLCMRKKMSDLNPSLIYDLQKYHPEAWNLYLESKEAVYIRSLDETLKSGMAEGYFREDINPGILAVLRVEQIEMALNNRAYPRQRFDFKDVLIQLFDHFLNGLVSEKGRKLLKKYQHAHVELNSK
ncbi:MAG: TetR/AcrR family transcriptional regulator [Cyclobacteriaceae bacterium]|nr:TetR/AcrR family transcriptional regulator [Cyclobacteriaceae bacterium]